MLRLTTRLASSRLLCSALVLHALSACRTPTTADHPPEVPSAAEMVASATASGMVRVTFPAPDPGIPAYARLGAPLDQIFHDDAWVVIPFYRSPDAVPGGFNLLDLFAFPGPGGPGAFGAPLLVSGHYMIEQGAPLGTFPKISISSGEAVPVWFVSWPVFREAMADNVVTMDELRAMSPLRGVASRFQETLRPRAGEHLVVINASGQLADGRTFDVHITHVEARTQALRIRIR